MELIYMQLKFLNLNKKYTLKNFKFIIINKLINIQTFF